MRITCPECDHQQTIDDDQAGASVACESCRHRFNVEVGGGIQEGLPPTKTRSADDEERRPRDRSRQSRPAGSSSGGVIALVIGGVLLIFFLLCGAGAIGGFFFAAMPMAAQHDAAVMIKMPDAAVAEHEHGDDPIVAIKDGPAINRPVVQPDPDVKPAVDAQERIRNGDFEQGHKGFRTQYQYSPLNLRPELAYDVLRVPQDAHTDAAKFGDHTTGKGNMLMVNGGHAIDQLVWGQTTDVRPGTEYTFSLWVASWTVFENAQLDVRINGKSIGQVVAPQQVGEWKQLRVTWNAGTAKAAAIEIYDLNQGFAGNDFAIDDISLRGPTPK